MNLALLGSCTPRRKKVLRRDEFQRMHARRLPYHCKQHEAIIESKVCSLHPSHSKSNNDRNDSNDQKNGDNNERIPRPRGTQIVCHREQEKQLCPRSAQSPPSLRTGKPTSLSGFQKRNGLWAINEEWESIQGYN